MRDFYMADGGEGHHDHRGEVAEPVDVSSVEELQQAGLEMESPYQLEDDVAEGVVAEEEFCLARQVEDQEDVVGLQLLQAQRFHSFGVSEDVCGGISLLDCALDLLVQPLHILLQQFRSIQQGTIRPASQNFYPSQNSSMISSNLTIEQISISPPSAAQSRFTLIADPAPNISSCMSASVPARVLLPAPLGPIIKSAFMSCNYYRRLITNIIQMEILQTCMLRRENAVYKLRWAMAALKLQHYSRRTKSVSFRDGEFTTQKTLAPHYSSHSIELENKELYLRYVEEVLTAKESELVQLQEHLNQRRVRLEEQEGEFKVANPFALNHHAELITKKIQSLKDLAHKLVNCRGQAAVVRELEEFQAGLAVIEQTCRKNQEKTNLEFLRGLQQLNAERMEVGAMKSKIHELESYEKYLNELQGALEHKEYQLILKEREMQQLSLAFCQSNSQTLSLKHAQFNTYQEEQGHSDQSIRKRTKIFEPRPTQEPNAIHKESSKIMQENSTNDYTKQTKLSKESEPEQPKLVCSASQTQALSNNDLNITLSRLECEKATLKFVTLWVRFSQKANKGGVNHKKCMGLYLWRLNALYDGQAKKKIERVLAWPRKLQRLGDLPAFDYKDLSLRKKRYVEQFFTYQRKQFQRKKILTHLYSVIKNRNRRERTVVYLSFQKYRNNAKMMSLMSLFQQGSEAALTDRPTNLSQAPKKTPNRTSESRILGNSSSTFGENRVSSQHSRAKLTSSKGTTSACATSKTKLLAKDQAAIDIPKLKEYIKNQEETEVKLATECAQTEAVFRVFAVLTGNLYRTRTRFLVNTIRIGETNKLNVLEKAVNSCEFKWQLFMAKARLTLTNNSNKIAHLEQLVGFMDCK